MKTRILSYLLVFSMILALLPASALAEGESTTTQHVTATVKHAFDSSGAETGQITAQIEAYLTDTKNQSHTVKPCDIIFLIEQSTFMNTPTDTTQYGKERADILNSMESLLQNLPTPPQAANIGWQSQALGVSITAAHPIHTSKVSTPAHSYLQPKTPA